MKTPKLIILIFCLIISTVTNAQSWNDFSDFSLIGGDVLEDNIYRNSIDFLFNNDNQPVVAYSTKTNRQLKVLRYDGSSWSSIGDLSFLTLDISQVDIEIVSNGDIYIAYTDISYQELSIIKFDGTSWSYVAQNITVDGAYDLNLATDISNNIYIVYRKKSSGANNAVKVKKYVYDSQNIENIGEFTGDYIRKSVVKINPLTNESYLGVNLNSIGRVFKFDNTSWDQVGDDIFFTATIINPDTNADEEVILRALNLDMAFSSNGELYVSMLNSQADFYSQYINYVVVLNDSNWDRKYGIGIGSGANFKLKKDNLGNVYFLATKDDFLSDPEKIMFIRFSSDGYTILDDLETYAAFYGTAFLELNFDIENIPYAIYHPTFRDGSGASYIRKFEDQLSVNDVNGNNLNLSVFPNPSSDFISINGLIEHVYFKLFNIFGKNIISGVTSNDKKINISNLSKGMYFLKIEKFNTLKVIKK